MKIKETQISQTENSSKYLYIMAGLNPTGREMAVIYYHSYIYAINIYNMYTGVWPFFIFSKRHRYKHRVDTIWMDVVDV